MADKGQPEDGSKLEMPSFSLRRKREQAEPEQPDAAAPDPEPTAVLSEPAATHPELPKRERRPLRLPGLGGLAAVLVTGAVIGALAVLLTWLATSACDAVRGTESCGGGPGLLILVASLVLLAYLGAWLLRAFGVPDPGSTSFLGVGLMAVVAMLFFIDVLFEWWMVIAVPLMAMAGYALSWWVTTRVVNPADLVDEEPERHDVE